MGLVIGGAIGNNLIDRVVYGRVADFFHFYAFGYDWYVFNVADIAITLGAVAIIYEVLKPEPAGLSRWSGAADAFPTFCFASRCWVVGLAALSAARRFRDEAGLTKQSPDEFAVVTKAPLIIPPNFNLRPPSPGAAPLNQTGSHHRRSRRCSTAPIPQTVAAQHARQLSRRARACCWPMPGCRMPIPPSAPICSPTSSNMQGADPSFTDRILGSPASSPPPKGAAAAAQPKRSAAAGLTGSKTLLAGADR